MSEDDMILMSESIDGLQNMLNTMSLYTENGDWELIQRKLQLLCSVEFELSEMMKMVI